MNKYMKANYDRINLVVPKGRKADIEAVAKANGESVNGYINALLWAAAGLTEEEWKEGTKNEP